MLMASSVASHSCAFGNSTQLFLLCALNQTPPMFEQTFKNIDDILWKEAGCQSELDYVEQTSWIIFLKYLDDLERERRTKAELTGKDYEAIIAKQYRWDAWAAPKNKEGKLDHHKA